MKFALVLFLICSFLAVAKSEGLIRSIWSCDVPCVSEASGEFLAPIHVSYCSTSTLSLAMIKTLNPVCQRKTNRADAVAFRSWPGKNANCVSSSNTCSKEGLVRAGFTCNVMCPSQDDVVHKFTACATTADEAWSFAVQVCKDATSPDKSYFSPSKICIADGQTGCE